jgi:hypothetical protein
LTCDADQWRDKHLIVYVNSLSVRKIRKDGGASDTVMDSNTVIMAGGVNAPVSVDWPAAVVKVPLPSPVAAVGAIFMVTTAVVEFWTLRLPAAIETPALLRVTAAPALWKFLPVKVISSACCPWVPWLGLTVRSCGPGTPFTCSEIVIVASEAGTPSG